MPDVRSWIGLSLVPEIGPVLSRRLLAQMGSPEEVFRAGTQDLLSVKGISEGTAQKIRQFRLWDEVDRQLRITEREGVRVVTFEDPEYPEVLREVDGAPVLLYMKGTYLPEDRYAIAVVGSRDHTGYGEAAAQKISFGLAAAGFTIVSGMARGIDTLAHRAALSGGARTIAVMGCGPDLCYPAENRWLMDRIAESGCVMTEFGPGTKPNRENFPKRNRVISGLSMGVVVVEATMESGSLITAKVAAEQNREVFAVPGSILSPASEGTNRLIREGAKLILCAEDVVSELAPVLKGFLRAGNTPGQPEISGEEKEMCAALTREPKHVDLISRETRVPVHRILEILLALELKGIVRQSHGKRFYLA